MRGALLPSSLGGVTLLLLCALAGLIGVPVSANIYSPPTPLWWINNFFHTLQFGQWESQTYLTNLAKNGGYFPGMWVFN